MRGHEALLSMRKAGYRPGVVFVDADPCRLREWASWQQRHADRAVLWVEPSDNVRHIDLRCLVALPVLVTGTDATRVNAIAEACKTAGASRVVASVLERTGEGEFTRFQAVETTDTEEVLTWPKS